jgi:hypothetical protein
MVQNQPKRWNKWLPMAEHWYNITYHTSLKTSSFEALYGYAATILPIRTPPKSKVEEVKKAMQERHGMIGELKRQLIKTQDRMKKFADEKKTEREFRVGYWVFLKLQPYMQLSAAGMSYCKLNSKYYGLF